MFGNKPKKNNFRDKPRIHHYDFAHIALRKFCAGNPLKFFTVMFSNQRDDFIGHVWQAVREQCDNKETADFTDKDIKLSLYKIEGYPAIIIEMPQACAIAEAILIGIVLTSCPEDSNETANAYFRYFVLEQSIDAHGKLNRTVFCEWAGDCHLNKGEGPKASIEPFIETIKQYL